MQWRQLIARADLGGGQVRELLCAFQNHVSSLEKPYVSSRGTLPCEKGTLTNYHADGSAPSYDLSCHQHYVALPPTTFSSEYCHQIEHTIAATMVQSSHHIPACETHLDRILNDTAIMVRIIKITLVATILGSAFSVRSVPGGVVNIGGISDGGAIVLFLSFLIVCLEAILTRKNLGSCSSVRRLVLSMHSRRTAFL